MKWSFPENTPEIAGRGYEILLDGEPQRHVTAFDTDEGWVDAWCLRGDECWKDRERPEGRWYDTPPPGEPHIDPDNPEEGCRAPRRYGHVQVIAPDGKAVA